MKSKYLYLKINKNNLVRKKVVIIKDVAKIYCYDSEIMEELNQLVIMDIKADKKTNYIFSVLKLIEQVSRLYPELEIENIGETDFIVEYEPPKKENKFWEFVKVFFVSCIVFFGAAFTIMTFNEDANVKVVFDSIYQSVMGEKATGGTILEISYAIGLPLGIIIFFNHFSKAKTGNDPTPMQVQLRVYEEDLDKTLIENASREGKAIDVD
ncbi:MAG: stage V sporulation protein AA [Anaerocolumna sp.]